MARQTSLLLLIIPFAVLPLAYFLAAGPSHHFCRCYPDDPCWPSEAEWGALNASLSGKLIATSPIGSVCHIDNPFSLYNSDACADLRADWPVPATHYETSSSPMAAWWTNFSCSPFEAAATPCAIGPLVRYAANVTSAADVQKVLKFVQRHNIRLVIRNTGHDYLGKSTGAGALAMWTHHLKAIQFEADYESSWYTGPALRIGAGVQGFEALDAAHALGFIVVTGHCPDVGVAGGYTQGGGHGQLASRFGLAADQVLEWEVVNAAGELLTASPTENADLYWALSGGGGGTYAVVLSMTVRLHPEEKTAWGLLAFSSSSQSHFWNVVRTFLVDTLPLLDAGGTALWMLYADPTSPGALAFSVSPITLPGGGKEDIHSYVASTLRVLQGYNMTYQYEVKDFSSYYSCFKTTTPGVNVTEYNVGGRLISRSTIQFNTDGLISVLQATMKYNVALSGFAMSVAGSKSIAPNAANPVWREAAISFVVGIPFNYTNRQANVISQRQITHEILPRVAALTLPGEESGAYLNEGDFNQPNWQSVFYGRNYPELLRIKDRYDPGHVFYGRTTVGSERWAEREDGRLCRVR